jgi:hypothetical protein
MVRFPGQTMDKTFLAFRPMTNNNAPEDRSKTFKAGLFFVLVFLFFMIGFFQHRQEIGKAFVGLPGDDWTNYHESALNILQEGFWIPQIKGPYTKPTGFLYIYFLAFCYRIFGIQPSWVYLLQSALLGASVALTFFAFRRGLKPRTQELFLLFLCIFAFLDIQRYYTGRLLSENLFILEISLFFYWLFKGYLDQKRWARIASLGLLGLIFLTRPTIILFIPMLAAWLFFHHHGGKKFPYREFVLGLGLLFLTANFLGLRNYLVTGTWTPLPSIQRKDVGGKWTNPQTLLSEPGVAAKRYLVRTLYVAGFLPLVAKQYRYRPHWMLMWSAYLSVIILRIWWRQPFPFQEVILHIYILAMLMVIIGISGIANYGFRFIIPVVLPALAGAIPLMDLRKKSG